MKKMVLCLSLVCCIGTVVAQDTVRETAPFAVQQTAGIDTSNTDMVIYPNVNHGSFTLQVNDSSGAYFDLRIIDEKGRIVNITRLANEKGIQTLHFNLPHASKGVYTLQAIGRRNISMVKMIVY